jgi:alpha-glucosidase
MMLLTLRGTPVLYFGDEIGVVDTRLTKEDLRDPVGVRYWPAHAGRDPERTPMPWSNTPSAGFTGANVTPWLPFGDVAAANVDDQRADPESILNLTRDLLALRRATPALHSGPYRSLPSPEGMWAWARDPGVSVALNLSDTSATVSGISGALALCTSRSRDAENVGRYGLTLAPWQGAVIDSTRQT